MADSISAIPQQPFLGRLAEFLRFLEKDRPEFLPPQLGVMQGISKLALPQASTIENLSYGNQPFTMPPSGTGAMIPQAKTGRKPEIADLVSMISGVPGAGAVADVGTKLSNEAADALVRAITRNPQATAPGVLQETAMPFMQAVAPRTPGLLETPAKSELGFYSALEQATMPLQNKGTGAQFLAQIEKTAGVKPDEIKWTGLDEFLKSKPNVTKAEVQDYLAANRVNLQEVRLGEMSPENLALRDSALNRYREITDSIADTRLKAEQGLLSTEEAMGILRPLMAERGNLDRTINLANTSVNTKFSKYTLPGGENYREILLTLPERTAPFDPSNVKIYRNRISATQGTYTIKYGDNAVGPFADDIRIENNYSGLSDAEIMDVAKRMYEKGSELSGIKPMSGAFKSSHFDQPNILAHMRVNDRVVDGKKTLFIEEIQSDWHQAGRKKGYATKQNLESWYNQNKLENDPPFAALNDEQLRVIEANRMAGMGGSNLVPDAPFKTSWHELTLKRAIQEASEKGYDQIAFTTGKTQAERYDLSKQIDRIAITKTGGVWSVNAWKDGAKAITKDASTDADLANLVGKELAEKAIKQGGGEYAGLDLQVGGEGMKGFYDQILPKSLEKLGKKFDAKVGKTEMDGVEVWQMDITPKMRESVLTKGQPLFSATPVLPAGLLGRDEEE